MQELDTQKGLGFSSFHESVSSEEIKTSTIPPLDIHDSIFKKLANKESFSSDDVYKIVTAISKKEASKKMIETFMANLKSMADETKKKEVFQEDYRKADERAAILPTKQVGKNAYEIRSDILQMAISWAMVEDKVPFQKPSTDELLNLARKFYAFVENRRY